MTPYPKKARQMALASVAILPLLAFSALAQTDQQPPSGTPGQNQSGAMPDAQQDTVVARVGAVDIRTSEVMTQIGMLPDRLRSQPAELLIPMAVEQLILRQLVLQEATAGDIATDRDVQVMAEAAAQVARENVLVQAWLDRELADRVTSEAIDAAYASMQAASEAELPPLDQIREQLAQALRQQEAQALTQELLGSDLVVFYGPDGQPIASGQPAAAQSRDESDANSGAAGGQEAGGNADSDVGADGEASDAENSENESGSD